MLEQALTYKWYVALILSGLFILLYHLIRIPKSTEKRKSKRLKQAFSNFVPMSFALLVSSVVCIIVEFFSGKALLTAIIMITILSLIFEKVLFGTGLKRYLPFYLSSAIAGALIEIDWAQKGLGAYSQVANMVVVVFFGYFLFYYFAHKVGDAIAVLGGR